MNLKGWLTLIVTGLVVMLMGLLIHPVRGRDLDGRHAASPLKPWFDSLKSGKGPCCSDADGWALSDVDWQIVGNSRYRVLVPKEQWLPSKDQREPTRNIEMVWVDVEDEAVIKEPNRAKRTMVWPIWGYGGVSIRCFMPGEMG